MTTEIYTPPPRYTIGGIGPYAVPHAYGEGEITLWLEVDGVQQQLSGTDYSVSPAQAEISGDVLLDAGFAATNDGRYLFVVRETFVEQGWVGQLSARERGLEAQLDWFARSIQDLKTRQNGSLYIMDAAVDVLLPRLVPGMVLMVNSAGDGFVEGPSGDEVSNAQGAAASAATSATIAGQNAAAAAQFSAFTRKDVAELELDDILTYTGGEIGSVIAGDIIRTRFEGFAYEVAVSSAADQSLTTLGGVKLHREGLQTITLSVGDAGDYSTINAALEYLSGVARGYSNVGISAKINLLTGFIITEQIVASAIDMSWVTISSVDAVVTVDVSGFTIAQRDSSDKYPIIAAVNNGLAPVLGCVIDATNTSTYRIVGLYAASGGTVTVAPASGVKNCQYNAWAWAGKIVTLLPLSGLIWDDALRPVFTGATIGALTAWQGSHVSAVGWDMDDSKDAVICGGASQMDVQRSRARNSTGDAAYLSRDLGVMNARTSDASGAAGNGYIAYHLGKLNARHFDDTGYSCADNCGAWGFSVLSGGVIEAEGASAMGCGAGSVKAEDNGQASVKGLRGEGGTSPAVYARHGGRISAEGAAISGGSVNALRAELGGRIDAQGSTLTATSSTVYAQNSGEVEVSNSSVISAGDNALFAQDGGIIRGNNIVARGAVRAVLCRKAGEIWVPNSDLRKNGTSEQVTDVSIADAALVNMYNSQGGVSTAVNTLTAAGIIYR